MSEKDKENQKWTYILMAVICLIIILVPIILLLLQGNREITNSDGEVSVIESMTCSNDGIIYPFFKYDNSTKKSLKINVVLKDNKLDTINLVAKLYYGDKEQIKQSSAENHIALNESFYADSMDTDSFNANFSYLNDAMQMTLYAEAKDLNGMNAKYFLIETTSGYTKDVLKKDFNKKGLNCILKEKE